MTSTDSSATFRTTLLRSALTSGAVAAVLLASLVGEGGDPRNRAFSGVGDRPDRMWKESYSARFPGCVSTAVWPEGEAPVALVTLAPDGEVGRVEVGPGAGRRPPNTIGACR